MAGEVARSKQSRTLAEKALARLIAQLDDSSPITIIGGLVPSTLTTQSPVPHQGTIDVDLLLELGPAFDRDELDFGWLETALAHAGFDSLSDDGGWQWQISVDGSPVILEFICDVPDNPGLSISLPGTTRVKALNFAGPSPAAYGTSAIEISQGDGASVIAWFAGLGGYLLAKATAVASRRFEKDFYDFAFVILHNDLGGPESAGRAAADAIPTAPLHNFEDIVRQAIAEYVDSGSEGPQGYVRSSIATGNMTPAEILAQDAVTAVQRFGDAFGKVTGVESW